MRRLDDEAWAEHVRDAWAQQRHHPTATERLRAMNHTCWLCVEGNDWHPDTLGGQMYELRLGFHGVGVVLGRSKAGRLVRRATRGGETP